MCRRFLGFFVCLFCVLSGCASESYTPSSVWDAAYAQADPTVRVSLLRLASERALEHAVLDDAWQVRLAAWERLAERGHLSELQFQQALEDPRPEVRAAVLVALLPYQETLALEALKAARIDVQERVLRRLARAPAPRVRWVEPLLRFREGSDPRLRRTAGMAFNQLGSRLALEDITADDAEWLVPRLLTTASHPWLARLGPASIPALTVGLRQVSGEQSWPILRGLGRHGSAAVSAIPALEAIQGPMRSAAIDVMRQIGRPAIPALVRIAKEGEEVDRRAAIRALGKIGHPDETVLEVLGVALLEDSTVRAATAEALAMLGASSVERLSAAIKSSQKYTRIAALRALVDMPERPAPALGPVWEATHDSSWYVRRYAVALLLRVGLHHTNTAQALVARLADRRGPIVAEATRGLQQMKEMARPALQSARPAADTLVRGRIDALLRLLEPSPAP